MKALCIKCLNPDALVSMHLDGSGYFECGECGETFHCEEVRRALEGLANWPKLLKWAEAYPDGLKPEAE